MTNEPLGNYFLIGSVFIIGEILPTNKNLVTVSALQNYLEYKRDDPFMKRYRPERTMYLIFLDTIDIETLKDCVKNIANQYKAEYPYSKKEDFIKHHFSYTLHILKEILENKNAIRFFNIPFIKPFSFHFRYDKDSSEYIDYIFKDNHDLDYHLQYCNKVIEIIENFDYDNTFSLLAPTIKGGREITSSNNDYSALKSIWLPEAKYTIGDILEIGIEKGLWNQKYEILTKRGSMYGTGKTLLGSLAITLKGICISQNLDYKIAGEAFCSFFKIKINNETGNPYKAFSSGNTKITFELKRAFKIK